MTASSPGRVPWHLPHSSAQGLPCWTTGVPYHTACRVLLVGDPGVLQESSQAELFVSLAVAIVGPGKSWAVASNPWHAPCTDAAILNLRPPNQELGVSQGEPIS